MTGSYFGSDNGINKGIDKQFVRAEELYTAGSYRSALTLFLELYPLDSLNSYLCYRIGECYLKTGTSNEKAEYFLHRSLRKTTSDNMEQAAKKKTAPLESYKLLGDACHLNIHLTEAIGFYEIYIKLLQRNKIHDQKLINETVYKIKTCHNAIDLISQPVDVCITNLGLSINSHFPDYAPRLTADGKTMFYTSCRPENMGGKTYDGGQYFEDIYVSTKVEGEWSKGKVLAEPVNTVGNEAAMAISADGQELLIYKDDMGDGNIYSSRLYGDQWSTPTKLNSAINSKYWEPCGYISADGSTLYFVSDRPGGFGGTDIYKSTRKAGGDWGTALNLGPTINTPFNEYSPFLHPDGETLYFSSMGHKGMGGYDIFFSRTLPSDENVWLEPINVGYPINSTGDDAFYMVTADKQHAYYSSARADGYGEKDNYEVAFTDWVAPPLALVRGTLQAGNGKMRIVISDNKTQEILSVFQPNSKTGDFTYILTPGKSYNISYESDSSLFYSENKFVNAGSLFSENMRPVALPNISIGSKVVLNNLFFDFDKTDIRPNSQQELLNIYSFLSAHPSVCVEFTGFADSRGNDAYNRRLAKARAQSVVKFLCDKGIEASRMSTASSSGDVERKAGNLTVSQNAGRQIDRRVELKITGIN